MMIEETHSEYDDMETKKESLLGSINYFEHEIANYKKRRD